MAADDSLIANNPAERVSIMIKSGAGLFKLDFSDEQAKIVLTAAQQQADPLRRWVPWLCAYSGARSSEVCQLRREDIREEHSIWYMHFTPEAGPLKTAGSERSVPLHPALIDQGFLTFVESIKKGPLFKDLPPDKFGSRGGNGTKILGRWVQSLGIDGKRISPNHSWRRRFKTLSRQYDLAEDISNAITGHAPANVAAKYGGSFNQAKYREICKIPSVADE
jgi:integrase